MHVLFLIVYLFCNVQRHNHPYGFVSLKHFTIKIFFPSLLLGLLLKGIIWTKLNLVGFFFSKSNEVTYLNAYQKGIILLKGG